MNKKLNKTLIYPLTLALLFLTTQAYAQIDKKQRSGPGKEGMMKKARQSIVKELNLSEEQQRQVKRQRQKHMQAAKEVHKTLRAKKKELRIELEKTDVDTSKINAISSEIKSLFSKQTDLRIEGILSMKHILTPEQFQKLKEKRESHHGKMRNRRSQMKERYGDKWPEQAGSGPDFSDE